MAKRLLVAYGLWALGGPLGLHHVYLGRDSHALLWMLTLGGFGAGWLWDFWHIPSWVAAANGVGASRGVGGAVPTLSPLRLAGQVTVGMYFGLAAALGLPWVPALVAQPLAVALGVQLVSSVGDQTTEAPGILAAAFLVSLLFQGRLPAVLPVSVAASVAAQRHRRYKLRGLPQLRLPARLYRLALVCLAFAAPLAYRGLCGAAGVLGTLLALPRLAVELLLLPFRAGWHLAEILGCAGWHLAEVLGITGGSSAWQRDTSFPPSSRSERQQWAYEVQDATLGTPGDAAGLGAVGFGFSHAVQRGNSLFGGGPSRSQVLGLPAGSSAEDVHRSYRVLVKLWHPDHNRHRAEEAERRFIELQDAYEELAGPRRAAGG